jgi:hypothetical protein
MTFLFFDFEDRKQAVAGVGDTRLLYRRPFIVFFVYFEDDR